LVVWNRGISDAEIAEVYAAGVDFEIDSATTNIIVIED
jgi:hypothetical protein